MKKEINKEIYFEILEFRKNKKELSFIFDLIKEKFKIDPYLMNKRLVLNLFSSSKITEKKSFKIAKEYLLKDKISVGKFFNTCGRDVKYGKTFLLDLLDRKSFFSSRMNGLSGEPEYKSSIYSFFNNAINEIDRKILKKFINKIKTVYSFNIKLYFSLFAYNNIFKKNKFLLSERNRRLLCNW